MRFLHSGCLLALFALFALFCTLNGACAEGTPSSHTAPTPVAPAPTPVTPVSSVPVIADLTANFSTNSCTRQADGLTGRAMVVTFDFTDGGASLSGGHVEVDRVYNTGRSEFHLSPIPSAVTLTGTPTVGQLRIDNACPLYDNATSSIETYFLVDSSGQTSNSLSIGMTRPPGAP